MTLEAGMRKIALGQFPGAAVSRLGRFLTRGPGPSAATGALLAGAGAYATRPEGSDTLSTLDRVGRAGLMGAAVGGTLGATARRARDIQLLKGPQALSPTDLLRETGASIASDAKNVLKRQVHGLTGAYEPHELDAMNLRGRVPAQREAHLAKLRAADRGTSPEDLKDTLAAIHARGEAGEAARNAGITSLPGTLRGLIHDPKGTGKALWADASGGSVNKWDKGMVLGGYVGLPAAAGALDVARGDESEYGGPTVGRKLLRHGANMATGALTLGMPVGSGMVAQDLLMRPFGG